MTTDLDVVSDLHKIVYLCAFTDEGASESGAVDGGIGSNFHIAFNHDDPELSNFGVFTIDFLKTESVTSDDASGVDDDAIFDLAAVEDGRSRMEDAMGADVGMIAHVTVCIHHGVCADACIRFDDTERADAC